MRCNLDHLDNLDNLTQNPQQNRLFPDGFKIALLITLIILHSTAPANRHRRPQRTSVALMVNPRRPPASRRLFVGQLVLAGKMPALRAAASGETQLSLWALCARRNNRRAGGWRSGGWFVRSWWLQARCLRYGPPQPLLLQARCLRYGPPQLLLLQARCLRYGPPRLLLLQARCLRYGGLCVGHAPGIIIGALICWNGGWTLETAGH